MAKKRAKKQDSTSEQSSGRMPRKEPYNSDRVLALVERIREQAARLSQLARSMEDAGVGEVVVDGHAMLLRGMDHIDNFTDNAYRSVRVAKTALMNM